MEHRPQELLVKLIRSSSYTAKEVSQRSGVNESSLSRFLQGKQDLKSRDFFAVLESFSEEEQERYWANYRSLGEGWRSLIMSASPEDFEEICRLMAEWWASRSQKSSPKSRNFTDSPKAEVVL